MVLYNVWFNVSHLLISTKCNPSVFCSFSRSMMNTSEVYSYYGGYDDEYYNSCTQEPGPDLSDGPMVLPVIYYVLSCLGLLGVLKKAHILKRKRNMYHSSQRVKWLIIGIDFIGNTTVLWVLLRYIKLKTMTDICLLNLAVSDLILAVSLPLWAYNSQNFASCKLITGVYQVGLYFYFYYLEHKTMTNNSLFHI